MKFIFDKKTNSFQMKLEPDELELAKTNPESFKALLEHQNKVKETISNNLIEQIREQNIYRLKSEKISADERDKVRQQQLELERLNVQKSKLAWDRILYGGEVILDKVLPDQTFSNI